MIPQTESWIEREKQKCEDIAKLVRDNSNSAKNIKIYYESLEMEQ